MMRKFRVWNKATSKWVYGPGKEVSFSDDEIALGGFRKNIPSTEWKDYAVLGCIGFKDGLGNEIYGGDCLGKLDEHDNILRETSEYEAVKNLGKVEIKPNFDMRLSALNETQQYYWQNKVIGNIFDNEELMKII
jgi:hypothetical protein